MDSLFIYSALVTYLVLSIAVSVFLAKREDLDSVQKIAQIIMPFFSFLMPKNYKPIKADLVAKSMVNVSKSFNPGFIIYHYPEIIKISK